MSGANFTPPPYKPHIASVIKQADESKAISGGTVPITDDADLFVVLKPSTIYSIRIMLVVGGALINNVWRPACTQTVDFFALVYHRGVAANSSDVWTTGSAADHMTHSMNTSIFNAGTPNFTFSTSMSVRAYGMVQTGSNGGTFSIKWGGSNNTTIMRAGSFMHLLEAQAY